MKELRLSQGRVALVDDEDYERCVAPTRLGARRWQVNSDGYACSTFSDKTVKLHRFVLDAEPGTIVDHINGNKLDCQKANMRYATKSQNGMNRPGRLGNAGARSKYRGVVHRGRATGKPWYAAYRSQWLANCATEEEAAYLYDLVALRAQGPRAQLNFPIQGLEALCPG